MFAKISASVPEFLPRIYAQTPRYVGGDSCAVYAIEFPGRPDLGGSLHPQISKLPKVQYLDLDETNVSGSLDVLANNTELEYLWLRHTRVTGRLEDLSKAKRLRELDLTGTEVTGDLAALANTTKLLQLRLSNTAVFGELKSLAKLTKLTKLDLANLKVGGDVAVMAEWSKIEHVDLSGTQAQFDLFQQVEPFNRTEYKWQCKWQELRFLDVSRTPEFSQAQDLLRPFAGCGKLATLKAAGCGLSGPLWPVVIVTKFGSSRPIDKWPLSQVLSVLDFARNDVTEVAELPRSCRTLVLSGNPHVSFGPGVVEKAIKEVVFIDLRNATFANLSDALLLIGQLAVITHVPLSIVVGHRPSYGRGTKCVFLGFCCVDATQVMGVMGWGGGDGNVPWRCTHGRCYGNDVCLGLGWG